MKNYNAKHVLVTANGVPLTGMGEAGFVSVKPKSPRFITKVGADGLTVRTQVADNRVDIEVVLLASSPSNGVLQLLHRLDVASGIATFPFSVEDLHGRMIATVATAWVVAEPDLAAANEEGEVTWILEGEKSDTDFAGSQF